MVDQLVYQLVGLSVEMWVDMWAVQSVALLVGRWADVLLVTRLSNILESLPILEIELKF
jgi:hypothetical protein